MKIETIVFDMDGTALNDQKEMDKVLIANSHMLQEQGVQLIIASGRHEMMTYNYYNELQLSGPIIGCNGATITYPWGRKEPIYIAKMPLDEVYLLIAKAQELGILYHIFTLEGLIGEEHAGRLAYYSDANESKTAEEQVTIWVGPEYLTDEYLKNTVKFLLVCEDMSKLEEFAQYTRQMGYEPVMSGDGLMDVMAVGNNKGTALQHMHDAGEINLATTMAFGDNYNDLEMLEVVDFPIVMANAHDDIKKVAYDICGQNNDCGVGEYVVKHVLKK